MSGYNRCKCGRKKGTIPIWSWFFTNATIRRSTATIIRLAIIRKCAARAPIAVAFGALKAHTWTPCLGRTYNAFYFG